MHPSSVHQGEERCCQPVAQKVQGAPMLLGSRDKQRPARCAGLARTTGGHDISGSRSGVGQTLPLRADGATTNDCALKMRATPSLRPTPPASGEIKSTNGGLHSCQSVFAVGRAVACPGIGSPCISGVPQSRILLQNGQNRWIRARRCLVNAALRPPADGPTSGPSAVG